MAADPFRVSGVPKIYDPPGLQLFSSESSDCKPFSAEMFYRAVDDLKSEKLKPHARIYSPREYKALKEDAIAFGIDMTDPQWDTMVMTEWVLYRKFERYLLSMGWRKEPTPCSSH